MWTNLSVCLSDVVEVRGSAITENEAWKLILEIGQQLKNVPFTKSQDYIITPNNVLLHPNGSISINFSSKTSEIFSSIFDSAIALNNVLTYSLGMTVLWCLQYGIPRGKYLNVSKKLQFTLNKMTSTESDIKLLQQILDDYDFNDAKKCRNSVAVCFIKMYESVLGSTSNIAMHVGMSPTSESNTISNASKKMILHTDVEFDELETVHASLNMSSPIANNEKPGELLLNIEDSETSHSQKEKRKEAPTSPHFKPEATSRRASLSQVTSAIPVPRQRKTKSSFCGILQPTVPLRKDTELPQHKQKSMLKFCDSPIQMNLCVDKSDFEHATKILIECSNGKNINSTINPNKTTCGQLLSMSLSQLNISCDTSLFGLTIFQDGEHNFLDCSLTLHKVISLFNIMAEPHIHLRLKFLPQDFNLIGDENLLQSMYIQIRKDIIDGRFTCNHEQAMMLAAYSMQYELGDFKNSSEYFQIKDFVSSGMIDDVGSRYLYSTLPILHARLKGTSRISARELYFSKAKELSEFGCHFIRVFMARKCQPSSSVWISIGPRGLKIFHLLRSSIRKIIHDYSWEQLTKVAYKGVAVLLTTKNGTRIKFYVGKERKSKYIVRIMGEMHQFHRLDDSWNTDQFKNLSNQKQTSLLLPFKRHTIPHALRVDSRTKSISEPDQKNVKNEQGDTNFSNSDLHEFPEIAPFVSDDEKSVTISRHSSLSLNKSISNNQEITKDENEQPIYDTLEVVGKDIEESMYTQEKENTGTEIGCDDDEYNDDVFDMTELPVPLINDLTAECLIELEKRNGTFGFSVLGGSDKQINVIKVQHIVPGGSAELNGCLQTGDVILAINDMQLSYVTHKEAVEILNRAPNKSRLHIRRDGMLRLENHSYTVEECFDKANNEKANVTYDSVETEQIVDDTEHRAVETTINSADRLNISRLGTYDERVSQVASAFYNYQYTDIQSDFQHEYIGSGAEDLSLRDEHHTSGLFHGEDISRGEGDGISNLSSLDHQNITGSTSQSGRFSDNSSHISRDVIPEATAVAIADFEDFRRRLSSLKTANESSSNSGDNESWSTIHG